MASVTAFIRTTNSKAERANVRFRLRDGRNTQLFYKSSLEVKPTSWDPKKNEIKAKVAFDDNERAKFNQDVANTKKLIRDVYSALPNINITSEILKTEIDKKLHPEKYGLITKPVSFFESFNHFLQVKKLSEARKGQFQVIFRALQRYELYKRLTGLNEYRMTFENVTAVTLRDFKTFLIDEHKFFKQYPEIYKALPMVHKTKKSVKPEQRSKNTINGMLVKLRTFFIWANENELTNKNPFRRSEIPKSTFGTPFFLTLEERNQLLNADFSDSPQLGIQRDIFVFQCCVGCRVGDLLKMTRNNIINGAVEYIASKTTSHNPVTVRVPLNSIALQILDKYKDHKGPGLFPFVVTQRYNVHIRSMLEKAGINRTVTVLNPLTEMADHKPIYKVAGSHLARRTFIGNLYRKVADPNLIASLSGHAENSRAFVRYRTIDEEMKTELVKMLE
jgi:integrase